MRLLLQQRLVAVQHIQGAQRAFLQVGGELGQGQVHGRPYSLPHCGKAGMGAGWRWRAAGDKPAPLAPTPALPQGGREQEERLLAGVEEARAAIEFFTAAAAP
ncbi:hypothetical protein GCM10027019_20210 [Melaminivora jejuensis]